MITIIPSNSNNNNKVLVIKHPHLCRLARGSPIPTHWLHWSHRWGVSVHPGHSQWHTGSGSCHRRWTEFHSVYLWVESLGFHMSYFSALEKRKRRQYYLEQQCVASLWVCPSFGLKSSMQSHQYLNYIFRVLALAELIAFNLIFTLLAVLTSVGPLLLMAISCQQHDSEF